MTNMHVKDAMSMVTYAHECYNVDANILIAFTEHDHWCKTNASMKAGGAGAGCLATLVISLAKVSDQPTPVK